MKFRHAVVLTEQQICLLLAALDTLEEVQDGLTPQEEAIYMLLDNIPIRSED